MDRKTKRQLSVKIDDELVEAAFEMKCSEARGELGWFRPMFLAWFRSRLAIARARQYIAQLHADYKAELDALNDIEIMEGQLDQW